MSLLRSNVLAAKARLAKGNEDLKRRHQAGCFGVEVCALATNLRDAVLLELVDSALADLGESGPNGLLDEIALVAHGGHGRRDVAPYSDVDLMVLHRRGAAARVARLAERLLRDVFDVGLVLGHSVRTPWQACRLARKDSSICTSLMESRLLCGSEPLFQGFLRRFRRQVSWRSGNLMATIVASRQQERARYGETVFLLEPNVKRSAGGLRDLQLLRWIGWVRYGTPEPRQLHELGVLGEEDFAALRRAGEFLLWLRNELHFHAGQAADVLTRFEQVRIADALGYQPVAGLLPVEQFMREYFRHTSQVSHVVRALRGQGHPRRAGGPAVHGPAGPSGGGGAARGPGGDHRHPPGIAETPRQPRRDRPPGRVGEPLRRADRAGHLGIHPPRGPATQRRAVAGGLPLVSRPAVASRTAGHGAPRPARRRHPGTLHSRVRPRPRPAAIQPVSQVHGGRALPAGGGVCGRPGRRPGAVGTRLSRHRRQARAAPGAVDPRPGQGVSGRPPRDRSEDRRRGGPAARPARPGSRAAEVPRPQAPPHEPPGLPPRHQRGGDGGAALRSRSARPRCCRCCWC